MWFWEFFFLHILRYYSALLSSIFSTFWTFNKCDFIFFSLENENCKIFSWSGVSIIGFLLSFSLFIFHFFRFSFFVFQFSVFVFVICFQFFVFWFSFLLFVFRFSLFVFIFFASSFCARRALLAGPRYNATHFSIVSMSTCSVHLAHEIDLKKYDPDGFFVEKKNLFL